MISLRVWATNHETARLHVLAKTAYNLLWCESRSTMFSFISLGSRQRDGRVLALPDAVGRQICVGEAMADDMKVILVCYCKLRLLGKNSE